MSEASARKSLAKAKGMELLTGVKRGTIKFIHGDSRFLPQALCGVDTIAMSPPFSESHRKDTHKWLKGLKHGERDRIVLSDSNDQIANLKYDDIDLIAQSPPYSHGSYADDGTKWRKENPEWQKGSSQFNKAEHYSEDPNNIGQKRTESYLLAMQKVYHGCYHVLKKDGCMVLVTKNFVKEGKEVRLDKDTIRLCESVGFQHIDTYYAKLNSLSFWQILHRKRCSNIKFTKREKLKGNKLLYACGKSGTLNLDQWDEDSRIPMCKNWPKAACPYELGEQKSKCEEYFNNYPRIEHESVLIFKKV